MTTDNDAPSIRHVMEHVRRILRETPFRKSGSGQDLRAGRGIVELLRGYGLEAELEEFDTYDSDPGEAAFEILAPERLVIAARACAHIEPTDPAGYRGEIVDVGPGGEADYRGKDVRGRVVLAEVSYAPATPEKARIAARHGAAGIVLMNWGSGDEPGIPWRGLKAVWGNPTPETWPEIPRLFGISISRRDGEAIRGFLAKGRVETAAKVTASREWRRLVQPIGWLHAPESAPERGSFVIVSGHLDSWSPGVTDNISGNAVMLEIARGLAARRERLRRSVAFCFWNGHEVAEAAGSAWFVDRHWERINRDAVAYLNIDSVGMRGTRLFNVSSSPELREFVAAAAAGTLDAATPIVSSNLERVGDQSFFGIGVSAATGRHGYSPDDVRRTNGATLGWYNHTEHDTLDVLDETVLASDLAYWARVVGDLATCPILPHRFAPRLDDLRDRFARMLAGKSDPAGLSVVAEMIGELAASVDWLDERLDAAAGDDLHAARHNRVVRRLARLLTFLSASASGKYGQDSYGISTLKLPIPLLSDLDAHAAAEPDGLEARLLATKLMRVRHTMTDALQSAIDLLADHRAIVEG